MELMQRIGWSADTAAEEVEMLLEMCKSYPDACDNVWLCTLYGYPPIKKHKEYADRLALEAERLRKNHLTVSLQLSNTLGHEDKTGEGRDCLGLVYEGSPAERMVGHDGSEAKYCFCWRGSYFKEYILEALRYYMVIKPDVLWIDDDLRADNHLPVKYGCFCEHCIAAFNDRYQSSFDREQLVQELLYGDRIWRKRYIEFVRQGLYEFTYEIAKCVHEISPDTVIGIQICSRGANSGFDHDHLVDAVKKATGKPPKFRPGGGAYHDHDPNMILEKMVDLNYQKALLPECVTGIAPEIENTPCLVFGKTPAGTAFETSCYFANGCTDMSYSMLRYQTEDIRWHLQEFKLFSEQRAYWEELAGKASFSHQSGISFFLSRDSWDRKVSQTDGMRELNDLHYNRGNLLLRDGIPLTFYKEGQSVILLHPEMANIMSDREIKELLHSNVITDGETIAILSARGYDFGIKAQRVEDHVALNIRESMRQHIVNPEGFESWNHNFYTAGRSKVYYLYQPDEKTEVISVYENKRPLESFTGDQRLPYGIATAVIETLPGTKWAVLGYAPWKGIISMNKRDQFLNLAEYISVRKLAARVLSPVQGVLLPRENTQGQTIQVSFINCTIGDTGEIKMLIRRPASENFYFISQIMDRTRLDYRKQGEDYVVIIPDVKAWTVGTVFCEGGKDE